MNKSNRAAIKNKRPRLLSFRSAPRFSLKAAVIVVIAFGGLGSFFILKSFAYYPAPCQWHQIGASVEKSYHGNNLYVHFYKWYSTDGHTACTKKQFQTHLDLYRAPYQPGGTLQPFFKNNSVDGSTYTTFGSTGGSGAWVNVGGRSYTDPQYNCDYGIGTAIFHYSTGSVILSGSTGTYGCY